MKGIAYLTAGFTVCLGDVLGTVFGVAGAELWQVTFCDGRTAQNTRRLGFTFLSSNNTL